ncbi:hypothetical protein LOK49_LG15G02486 [Camellia lanceoleosa]|uniref:Uncharacterized protein n=1 Tax=Camellia lanceoleosa TaxID=1840588 RepID=A0ACC0F3T5_9ERIC|nr:hypothetical protein LOK49_LG15G02486 [Camellia lanceoleosa]
MDFEYEEPQTETVQEGDCDTLLVYLRGFEKGQLKLHLTKTRTLLVTGERVQDKKGIRVKKEYPIATNSDANRITAAFNNGILYIRQPKLITSSSEHQSQTTPTPPPPPPPPPPPLQPRKSDVKTPKKSVESPPSQPQKSDIRGSDESKQMEGKEKSFESMDARNEISERKKAVAEEKGADVVARDGKRISDERVNGDSGGGFMVGLAKKLGVSMNWVVVVLLAVIIVLYVKNWIQSGKKPEN